MNSTSDLNTVFLDNISLYVSGDSFSTSWSEIPNELHDFSNSTNISQLLVVDKDNNLAWRDRDLYENFERNSTNDGFTFHHKYYKESTQQLEDDESDVKILPIQYPQGNVNSTVDKVLKSNGQTTYLADDNNDNNEPQIDETQSHFTDDGKINLLQKKTIKVDRTKLLGFKSPLYSPKQQM